MPDGHRDTGEEPLAARQGPYSPVRRVRPGARSPQENLGEWEKGGGTLAIFQTMRYGTCSRSFHCTTLKGTELGKDGSARGAAPHIYDNGRY